MFQSPISPPLPSSKPPSARTISTSVASFLPPPDSPSDPPLPPPSYTVYWLHKRVSPPTLPWLGIATVVHLGRSSFDLFQLCLPNGTALFFQREARDFPGKTQLGAIERCDPGAVLLASAGAFTDTRRSIVRLKLHFQAGATAHQHGSSAHLTVRHFQGSGTFPGRLHIRA
jgi:hypothetical protein